MTNLEALQSVVDIPQISILTLTKVLIDAEIDGAESYVSGNASKIYSAAAAVLRTFMVSSVSEGGYSISFDRSAIEKKIAVLDGSVVRGVERLNI